MKIQVNTDAHIDGHERLVEHVSGIVARALARFKDHVTRVEVHLRDENADKTGPLDQRCMLEVRLEGRQPVAVTEHAATQEQAVNGATQKMVRLLDSTFGRVIAQRHKVTDLPADESE